MAKPEWGAKRVCQSCAAKFYDLGRDPIACPKCGTQFNPEALLKSRRSRPAAAPRPAKAQAESIPKDEVKPKVLTANNDTGTGLDKGVETGSGVSKDDDDDVSVLEDASEFGESGVPPDVTAAAEDKDD